jgi:hypothetical protein
VLINVISCKYNKNKKYNNKKISRIQKITIKEYELNTKKKMHYRKSSGQLYQSTFMLNHVVGDSLK